MKTKLIYISIVVFSLFISGCISAQRHVEKANKHISKANKKSPGIFHPDTTTVTEIEYVDVYLDGDTIKVPCETNTVYINECDIDTNALLSKRDRKWAYKLAKEAESNDFKLSKIDKEYNFKINKLKEKNKSDSLKYDKRIKKLEKSIKNTESRNNRKQNNKISTLITLSVISFIFGAVLMLILVFKFRR